MDGDNQSEDGEIKKSPTKDMDEFSFSEEDGADTADSLDIKPPQAVIRHRKITSSHRREKHSERHERREEKERKSRHHERTEERHRDKHRHRRHIEGMERSDRSDGSKRERDRVERMEGHGRERESRHERKERNAGDRVLEEDLRERLLDKRRERREDPREMRESRRDESREIRDTREFREIRERREIRIDEMRDRREIRVEDRRHIRVIEEQYSETEIIERPEREKRHKRSHKHERTRDREHRDKIEREREHREKQLREAMDVVEEPEDIDEMEVESTIQTKDPKEMSEQELRKESNELSLLPLYQRLLEADREMARRKEVSRMELEARRLKRGEKRSHSPDPSQDPSIVELSDDSPSPIHSDEVRSKSIESQHSSEERRSARERSSERSDSSDSSSDEDEDSNESNKGSNEESVDGSDYNNPSPLSVDRLAKSDHSDGDSPGRIDSNGAAKDVEESEKKEEEETEPVLPPYLPAIQGCRSVEEFQCLNRIEEGTYGVVYRARDKRTEEIVALKRLKMEKEKEGFPITSLREINTLLKAQHPNIVTVREIVVGSNMDKIFIVMDYVEHDLKSLMETMKQKKQVFIPGEVKCLMQQLLRAVTHLHDNWILHRDLKTSNLLLSHRGILKVGDFGLAREYGSPLRQYTPVVVTLWYRAPELLLNGNEYSTPIDIWSVGCIFAELLRMEALFPGKSEIDQLNRIFKELGTPSDRVWPGYSKLPMVQKIPFAHYPVNNLRQRFSLSLSDLGIELLNKFLTYDPQQRIAAEDALKHGYFTEAPLPIDPEMFPTWPAKSELGVRTANASPKPPSGGREYKQLGDGDDGDQLGSSSGFHMGLLERGRPPPMGGGFHLKF
ncbi:cyclin-dependent kinase 11A isoform X2 [Cephus cinctus]|uniref:cyclin-dependent kinase n=1 Tax=Cephus cinctus TaxID=211228 RepID=A0AAJ7CCU9_CEPCN|nr:cyclin-dependent kinase 11A isoform X2 [Cephus cinctus]